MIVNELAGSSFVHKMQGQLFKSQGFTKLGQKYMDHYTEEMGWVEKYTDRMLDLGCVPEVKVCNQTALIEDPKAYLEADLKLQKEGVEKRTFTGTRSSWTSSRRSVIRTGL